MSDQPPGQPPRLLQAVLPARMSGRVRSAAWLYRTAGRQPITDSARLIPCGPVFDGAVLFSLPIPGTTLRRQAPLPKTVVAAAQSSCFETSRRPAAESPRQPVTAASPGSADSRSERLNRRLTGCGTLGGDQVGSLCHRADNTAGNPCSARRRSSMRAACTWGGCDLVYSCNGRRSRLR